MIKNCLAILIVVVGICLFWSYVKTDISSKSSPPIESPDSAPAAESLKERAPAVQKTPEKFYADLKWDLDGLELINDSMNRWPVATLMIVRESGFYYQRKIYSLPAGASTMVPWAQVVDVATKLPYNLRTRTKTTVFLDADGFERQLWVLSQ